MVHTPPSGLTVAVPHAGHFEGGSGTLPRLRERCAFEVGDTTWGITSPARITITSSPWRTSLRLRSSSLWRVASLTVTPDTCTGSSWANGTMCPVRPTFQATRSSLVVAVMGANFQAMAPRGSRPTTPRRRCRSRSSTLTTTPSISKSSDSRRSSHARHAVTTWSSVSCRSTSPLTLNPCSRSQSSDSRCDSNSIPSSAPTE